jgi:hypothetical protein
MARLIISGAMLAVGALVAVMNVTDVWAADLAVGRYFDAPPRGTYITPRASESSNAVSKALRRYEPPASTRVPANTLQRRESSTIRQPIITTGAQAPVQGNSAAPEVPRGFAASDFLALLVVCLLLALVINAARYRAHMRQKFSTTC